MPDYPDRPGYSFNPGPPPEASRFLRNKGLKPAFSWLDVEPEEHAVAFSVAKATELDVLRDIREEVQAALDEGLPFAEFQKRLRPRLEKRGWWGYGGSRDLVDGQVRPALLGTPRRLKVIYQSNMRSARAAGQWERIQRTKTALPFLIYQLGASERHRPHHEAKEGLTLPVDDPFWASWYPPNGWGCKCWVRQITRYEADQLGIDKSPPVPTREFKNRRTGEIKPVPVGIDPGWERNPGALRQRSMQNLLSEKLNVADPTVSLVAARDVATSWVMKRILAQEVAASVPVGIVPGKIADHLNANTKVVLFSQHTAAKQLRNHPEVAFEDYAAVADLIGDGKIVAQKAHHIAIIQRNVDLPWVAIIKVTQDLSELYLQSFYRAGSSRYVRRLIARGETIRE